MRCCNTACAQYLYSVFNFQSFTYLFFLCVTIFLLKCQLYHVLVVKISLAISHTGTLMFTKASIRQS
eukprot:UN27490